MRSGPRYRRAPGRDRRQAGFTLLELLVALALMALMALVLTGGLRFGARVWEASRAGAEAAGEVAAVRGFIRQRAMAVRPVRLPRGEGGPRGALSGDRRGLSLVTLMPSTMSRGGLYHVALGLAEGESGLSLSWWPVGGRREGPGSGSRVLLDGAKGMEVSYFGDPRRRGEMTWRAAWPDGPGLPRLLSIKVTFPENDPRTWPELIVPLPAAVPSAGPRRPAPAPGGRACTQGRGDATLCRFERSG